MFVLVLAAEADETRQTVTFLIGCLVAIAVVLSLLTAWYWFYTDPKRRRSGQFGSAGPAVPDGPAADVERAEVGAVPARASDRPPLTAEGVAQDAVELTQGSGRRPAVVPGSWSAESNPIEPVPADSPAAPPERSGAASARETWDFVVATRRAEERRSGPRPASPPAAPRIDVADRRSAATDDGVTGDDTDELAAVRRRRERESERGLTDEAWASIQRSVFKQLES